MFMEAGVVVIIIVVLFAMLFLYRERVRVGGFFGIVITGIFAGAAAANLPRITSIGMTPTSFDVKLQEFNEKAQQVQTDAGEVRKMKEQIEALVKRLEKSEQARWETDKKLKDVQQQQTKRRLSDEQKQILVKVLSPFRGQNVVVGNDFRADDGPELIKDFKDVFREAKWSLKGESGTVPTTYEGDPTGIEIYWNKSEMNADRTPESAKVLTNKLFEFGMIPQAGGIRDEKTPSGQIDIRICRKP